MKLCLLQQFCQLHPVLHGKLTLVGMPPETFESVSIYAGVKV